VLTRNSFFGTQEGEFDLTINSIKAVCQSGSVENGIVDRGIGVRL
jgi:hypothetical protein